MKLYCLIFGMIFLAVVSSPGIPVAKMYKWKDENGVLHFSDSPSKGAVQSQKVYETSSPSTINAMSSLLSENPDDIIEFRDDFEYTDSPTNYGWKFSFGGNDNLIFTTSDLVYSGTRSLKGQWASPITRGRRFGLEYDLRQKGIGTAISPRDQVEIVIYWYDDGSSIGDANFHPRLDYIRPDGRSCSVSISDNSRGQYGIRKSDSTGRTFFAERTAGWHEIRFFIHNQYLDVYFDGVPVSKNHDRVRDLRRIAWYTNILALGQTTLSRIDNVSVTRHIFR